MSRVKEIIKYLSLRKKAISCGGKDGLLSFMVELGFEWKGGKTDGHKIFVHPGLSHKTNSEFTTHSLDCGHKPNRAMKFQYIVKTIAVLRKYEDELSKLIDEKETL